MADTNQQYQEVTDNCRSLFLKKTKDYGTSWRVLRLISVVDQIYIKAWRIRTIQDGSIQKIEDSIHSEFIGIVNYGIIALIQIKLANQEDNFELSLKDATQYYNEVANSVKELMLQKNHDYGEAWRDMSQQSFADLILVKLLRIKQIIANDGRTEVSEGADANFFDIVNYAIFALIKINES